MSHCENLVYNEHITAIRDTNDFEMGTALSD